jgi:hypothetical protein
MSLDERLHATLRGVGDALTDDSTDDVLDRVVHRSAKRRVRRRVAAGVAGAAMSTVVVAAVLVTQRPDHTTTAKVVTGPSHVSSSATTDTGTPPQPTFCPARYQLVDGPTRPGASIELATVTSSDATIEVGRTLLVGFPATEWTDGRGGYEIRVDVPTGPACGGQLAVVASGVHEEDLAVIASSVRPRYSLAERQEFQSIWPSSDLDSVVSIAANRPVLTDPGDAAISFATDQLGWSGGTVVDSQPSEDGTNGADLIIEETAGSLRVRVLAVPVPGTGYWAVSYASSFTTVGVSVSLSVAITADTTQPDTVASDFGDGASAQLVVAYGDQRVDLTTDVMPPFWSFELGPRPDIPGAMIIRWRDTSGKVIAVLATSLPPGDFAAS